MKKTKVILPLMILVALAFMPHSVWAANTEGCVKTTAKDIVVEFTGFKTPKKIGVKGSFPKVQLKSYKGSSWQKAILNNRLSIDASKIESGDKGRDIKIATFFFQNKKIEAKFISLDEKKRSLLLSVKMNGVVNNQIRMFYKLKGQSLVATGQLDVLDFSMSKNLKALTKACFEKHEGKTWSDVEIKFKVKMKAC